MIDAINGVVMGSRCFGFSASRVWALRSGFGVERWLRSRKRRLARDW